MQGNLHALRELIDIALCDHLPISRLAGAHSLNDAVRYAVFPGGKRLRPMLTLLGVQVVNGDLDRAMPAACAVEFLHTSSLVFDDLPAMDDADQRRGSPALHLAFGEDVALLAAIALLNQAYALFGGWPPLIAEAAQCIGADGMIGGQALDLARHSNGCLRDSFSARNRKTSALMRLTLTAGAIAGAASDSDVAALARAGECWGQAYQICDDLLDQSMLCAQTGKTAHQDSRLHRPSHAVAFGPSACQEQVCELIHEGKTCLTDRFGHTAPVAAMLSNIDAIVREFGAAGLVTA